MFSNAAVFKKFIGENCYYFLNWNVNVKCFFRSKLPTKSLETWSTGSVTKLNGFSTSYLLLVNGSKMSTKNFASLNLGVCKADNIDLKGGQPLAHIYALYKKYFWKMYFPLKLSICYFYTKKFMKMHYKFLILIMRKKKPQNRQECTCFE